MQAQVHPTLHRRSPIILTNNLSPREIIQFPNENIFVKLNNSARGQDVYVIQTTSSPVHYNLMELLIMIQTVRLDSAARITAVVPYLCYGRSDKKDQPRVPDHRPPRRGYDRNRRRRPLHDLRPARRADPGFLLHPRRCADSITHDQRSYQGFCMRRHERSCGGCHRSGLCKEGTQLCP